ncbi:hypothetical protein CLV46_2932 [Diaminobutyricimonas aerilata]|uniref:Uncharacterized protein n=1 Tax=Diaminobutyricimonas aerilata TaxID=1162967 RepID=A0A2M9CN65_9MICO|nr:hypothetical protein [Diaminobutyricimonas aerilata]PJJ73346.1 hypothetical protein CLV46_2932 [Diaminobutyricimonas aerilata]
MHTSPLRTAAVAAAFLSLGLLSGCAAPAPTPEPAPAGDTGADDTATDDTTDDAGDGSPYGTWSQALETQLMQLDTWYDAWTGGGCDVAAAIDAPGECRQLITTAQLTSASMAEVFSSRGDAPDEVADQLDAIEAAVDETVDAATPWAEQECMWELTDECAAPAEAIIDGVLSIHDAAEGWSA